MTSTRELKRRVRTPLICFVKPNDHTAVIEAKKWLEANKEKAIKAIEARIGGDSELMVMSQVIEHSTPGFPHVRCEAVPM